MLQLNKCRGKDTEEYISTNNSGYLWEGSGIRAWCSREHLDYLNYLNLYDVNYMCISYKIKTKVKFAFNNEGKKEHKQAGKHRVYWRSRKIEKEGKRITLKIETSRVRGMTQESFKEILL